MFEFIEETSWLLYSTQIFWKKKLLLRYCRDAFLDALNFREYILIFELILALTCLP